MIGGDWGNNGDWGLGTAALLLLSSSFSSSSLLLASPPPLSSSPPVSSSSPPPSAILILPLVPGGSRLAGCRCRAWSVKDLRVQGGEGGILAKYAHVYLAQLSASVVVLVL